MAAFAWFLDGYAELSCHNPREQGITLLGGGAAVYGTAHLLVDRLPRTSPASRSCLRFRRLTGAAFEVVIAATMMAAVPPPWCIEDPRPHP